MKKLQRTALGLALLAALAGGAADASAKNGSRQRNVNGIVQSVDLRTRTVEVREQETGRVISVRVPDGILLRTNSSNQRFMQIERLLPGMTITAPVE
jgi:hypothetical protein